MNLQFAGLIGLIIVFLLMFFRMHVGLAFAVVAFVGIWMICGPDAALAGVATIPYAEVSRYVFTVVPLFILMGYLAQHIGIGGDFYNGVRKWVGHSRGGMAIATILGNTGFGACTGDPLSATVTFTLISLPEMRRYGYADTLSLGSILAGGTLAPLIPPSTGFIIYGALTETSISKLFIAGIIPGLLLSALYIATIYYICWRNPAAGPPGPKINLREKLTGSIGMWGVITVFLVIIGGIYVGLFTPTEAGAFGAFLVIVLGLARRKLTWQGFKTAATDTGVVWSMVVLILIGVMIFNLLLVRTGIPFMLGDIIRSFTQSPIVFMMAVATLLFIIGMFVSIMPVSILIIPILHPIALSFGISPLQFAVVFSVMASTGALSPPFGLSVYAIAGMVELPISTLFRGVMPFLVSIVVCDIIIIFIPEISTWLPGTMFQAL